MLKDVDEDQLDEVICSIRITVNDDFDKFSRPALNVKYVDKQNLELYNVDVLLQGEQIGYFQELALNKMTIGGEIFDRIERGEKIYNSVKRNSVISVSPNIVDNMNIPSISSGIVEQKMMTDSYSKSSVNNISDHYYDSYTNNDGILHDYASSYSENVRVNGKFTDGHIVKLVPKELFFK